MVDRLIILSLILISKIQNKMHSEVSSAKLKPQRNNHPVSHLSTYQGEVIRKSICNDHPQNNPLKVFPLLFRRRSIHIG